MAALPHSNISTGVPWRSSRRVPPPQVVAASVAAPLPPLAAPVAAAGSGAMNRTLQPVERSPSSRSSAAVLRVDPTAASGGGIDRTSLPPSKNVQTAQDRPGVKWHGLRGQGRRRRLRGQEDLLRRVQRRRRAGSRQRCPPRVRVRDEGLQHASLPVTTPERRRHSRRADGRQWSPSSKGCRPRGRRASRGRRPPNTQVATPARHLRAAWPTCTASSPRRCSTTHLQERQHLGDGVDGIYAARP